MEMTTLGRTGVQVSRLCFGAMTLGRWGNTDEAECIRIVHRALDAGINFIDTADVYGAGDSESILGKALAGKRDSVVLATKLNHQFGEGSEPQRQLAPLDLPAGRRQPPAPQDRLDRPLPAAPPRPVVRHRRERRRAQRSRPRGQDPLLRHVDLPRPRDRRGPLGRRAPRARAPRLRAGAVLAARARDRGRRAAGRRSATAWA